MESKALILCTDFVVATSRFGELTLHVLLLLMGKMTEVPQLEVRKQVTQVAQAASLC